MKLCGLVRKLRSSQPTLQPMNVKIPLENVYAFGTMEEETRQMFNEARGEMDYYDWMQYLHDEIQKYEYKTSTKYWCSGDGSKILKEANTLMDNYRIKINV